MELFILVITLLILAEVSVIFVKFTQKPFLSQGSRRKVYVDTSALMDPRLLQVAKTGFISDDLFITRSVTHELQMLADGKDPEKRTRARAGLDTVRELERIVYFNTTIFADALDRTPVDNRLIDLARQNHGAILTNDYNLQKVAETEHIDVLNLNELALVLRNKHLPSEHATVRIVSEGSNPHQGVGYLEDGTMVVVDNASKLIGQDIEVEFIRLNQTASGTMLFAKLINLKKPAAKKSSPQTSRKAKYKSADKSARSRR